MKFHWLLPVAALFAAAPASAATLTVSISGSDGADGLTAPLRTVQKAVALANGGDTIVFQSGTYTASAWIETNNLTLRGDGDVTLDGTAGTRDDGITFNQVTNVKLDNLKIRNCRRYGVFCVLSDGLTITNCDVSYNGKTGILTGNTSHLLIQNCTTAFNKLEHGIYCSQSGDHLQLIGNRVFNNTGAGLQINAVEDSPGGSDPSSDSHSDDCLVANNTIYNNSLAGGAAMNLMGVRSSTIVNNLVYNDQSAGIALWDDDAGAAYACKNNRILNNTIMFQSGKGHYGIQIAPGSTGNTIVNNILCVNAGPALDTSEVVKSNFNCFRTNNVANGASLSSWQNSSGNDTNSTVGDPKLGSDYHPLAGSPVIDGGDNVYGTDHDGGLRPQGATSDIGAFEAGAGTGGGTGGGGTGGTTLYAISGIVTLQGTGLAGVTVSAAGQSVSTASNGTYTLSGIAAGSYTVSAGKSGYTVSAAQQVTVGPSRTSINFTATAVPPPTGSGALVLYGDTLQNGWTARASKASCDLANASPVKEGAASMALTITGTDGYVLLSGSAVAVSGKSTLKFWVNGGKKGGQPLRARAYVGGIQQVSVNLLSFGGSPQANGWTEYSVPLLSLHVTGGSLTGLMITAGSKQGQAFVDYIRVE